MLRSSGWFETTARVRRDADDENRAWFLARLADCPTVCSAEIPANSILMALFIYILFTGFIFVALPHKRSSTKTEKCKAVLKRMESRKMLIEIISSINLGKNYVRVKTYQFKNIDRGCMYRILIISILWKILKQTLQ